LVGLTSGCYYSQPINNKTFGSIYGHASQRFPDPKAQVCYLHPVQPGLFLCGPYRARRVRYHKSEGSRGLPSWFSVAFHTGVGDYFLLAGRRFACRSPAVGSIVVEDGLKPGHFIAKSLDFSGSVLFRFFPESRKLFLEALVFLL